MSEAYLEISKLISKVEGYVSDAEKSDYSSLEKLMSAQALIGKAWCGSWIGYHSKVYYDGLRSPPPGAHFSVEWGMDEMFGAGTNGHWGEYDFDSVYDEVYRLAGNPDLTELQGIYTSGVDVFASVKRDLDILLVVEFESTGEAFYKTLLDELASVKLFSAKNFISAIVPKQHSTRDQVAMDQGILTPPHLKVWAQCMELKSPLASCGSLITILKKAFSYIQRQDKKMRQDLMVGTNIFIGHGRSKVWRDLKDFIKDRLGLPYDEFNRVPVAGITNIQRLTQMLDSAAIAFVVMTAEDEKADGKVEARTNVIHEVGLFQGKLGFTKAIVLLEEGCEEFSNIQGLGQIRFPKGDIAAKFEDIRLVLEREGVIKD